MQRVKQYFTILLFLLVGVYIHAQNPVSSLSTAKNTSSCRFHDTTGIAKIRDSIPGNSYGQKLESLLFWSQEEKEKRFPLMQKIFPSIGIPPARNRKSLKKGATISFKGTKGFNFKKYFKDNNIAGVLVLQNGKIRLEKYKKGVNKNTVWTSFSMAKSVTSILLGVALKEGDIKSLDDPIGKYIPKLRGVDYGKVTVRQLLTMTSGMQWKEDYSDPKSDVAQMYMHPCRGKESHILSYMRNKKRVAKPGEKWHYNTGETDLLGILIQKATGRSLATYLEKHIWQPWGMQHCAYWLTDECSGLNIGGSGLSATLRDYARIGELMLHQGRKDGKSFLAKEWLKNATSPLYNTDEKGEGYGYLWWRFKNGSYAAIGIFGQMIYVNPKKHLVIAQIAAWPKATSDKLVKTRGHFIKTIEKIVETEE